MNGSQKCLKCGTLTSEGAFINGWFWCDEHVVEGRRLRANLARSKAAMGNRNAAKKSGNPAIRNSSAITPAKEEES